MATERVSRAKPAELSGKPSNLLRTLSSVTLKAVARVSRRSSTRGYLPHAGSELCNGRFIVGDPLGRGGMGVVYQAYDSERRINVALKTLLGDRLERLLALKQEFRSLQDLHNPNLVRLCELFEDRGRWFFTMELIHGAPFTEYVRSDRSRLRGSLLQLAAGLRALHRAGKVHRDVKPSNTLVEASGRVVLLDFGLIRNLRGLPEEAVLQAGTVAYMAPEQVLGTEGPPADWYAVGVMLYEALTGRLPFDGSNAEVLAQKRSSRPQRPSLVARDVPEDLDRLCMDLLERDPQRRPSGQEFEARLRSTDGPAPAPDDDSGPSTFVGRSAELARLHGWLLESRDRPIAVSVLGESGVGKSTLLERFAADALGSARVLAGRCYEHEFIPFKALDGAMDALVHQLARMHGDELTAVLPAHLPALSRIFPAFESARLARSYGLQMPDASARETRRFALLALRELLAGLARKAPIVVMLDDMQWADRDSLGVLEALLQAPDPPALLLVIAARTGWDALKLPCRSERLELATLQPDDATRLAAALLGPAELARDRGEPARLALEAHGHPLFIETLARRRRAEPAATSGGLEQALGAALEGLDRAALAVVEIASVATQPLPNSWLAAVARLDRDTLERALHATRSARLLRSFPSEGRPAVEPYHDAVRRAVLGRLAEEQRIVHHRRLAETLETLAPDRSEALARHWHAAGAIERAFEHAVLAAHRAREALAFDRAADLYGWALELHPGNARAPELHELHAEALANCGRGVEAAAAYRRAAANATEHARWDLLRHAAEQLLRSGHIEAGLLEMDQLLEPIGLARPRAVLTGAAMLLREHALEALQRVVPLRLGPTATHLRRMDACWAAALGLTLVDPLAASVFSARFMRLARQLGEPSRIALGLTLKAPLAASCGPPATRAHDLLRQSEQLMKGRSDPRLRAYLALSTTNVDFLTGDWLAAVEHGDEAENILRSRCAGSTWEIASAQRLVLDALWHLGRLDELEARAWQAWREADARGDRYVAIQLETTVLPILHLKNDDVPAAKRALNATTAIWPDTNSFPKWQYRQTSALVELYAGRPIQALQLVKTANDRLTWGYLWNVMAVRVFTGIVQVGAALGCAALGIERRKQLRYADRVIERLQGERMLEGTIALAAAQRDWLRGDTARALDQLDIAEGHFIQRGTLLLHASAIHSRGRLIGGTAGARLMHQAIAMMQAQGIHRPSGFIRLHVPAFELSHPH